MFPLSGCATKSECTNPATGGIYKGNTVIVNGKVPAGMKISVQCCKANKFSDDDALAIDMEEICNSAGRLSTNYVTVFAVVFVAVMLIFGH